MDNDLAVREAPMTPVGVNTAMIQTREMTEIQAMVISAKRFPRDIAQVRADILASCDSPALAEVSQYTYAKGGTEINGVSIRLAEEMACAFQNMDKGWVELERKSSVGNVPGESVVQCFAWDMQRNVKAKRTFTVRHWRDTKQGGYALKDEREIYELMANQAARRLRACILEIIPRFIQEEAITRCDETLKKNAKGGTLEKRIVDMVGAFAKVGVTKEMLEKRLQHNAEATSESEIIGLHKVYLSLVDGMSNISQWFDGATPATQSTAAADSPPPQTQSISKEKKGGKVETKVDAKPKVKNHATPEALAEAKAAKAEPEPAFDAVDVTDKPMPVALVKNDGPTFNEVWLECVAVCRAMNWTDVQLAAWTKEKFHKSPYNLKETDDVKTLVQVYETLIQLKGNQP